MTVVNIDNVVELLTTELDGEALPLSGLLLKDGLGVLLEDDMPVTLMETVTDEVIEPVEVPEDIFELKVLKTDDDAIVALLITGAEVVRVVVELPETRVEVTLVKMVELELLAVLLGEALPLSGSPVNDGLGILFEDDGLVDVELALLDTLEDTLMLLLIGDEVEEVALALL